MLFIEDQTEYIPQRWQIVVPRVRQILRLPGASWTATPPDSVLFNHNIDLNWWVKLAKPARSSHSQHVHHGEQAARLGQRTKLSRIETLPPELLTMILEDGLTKRDLIAVSLSSHILSLHVLHQIDHDSRGSAAPWAGHELACTGTHLTDLPEAFEIGGLFHSSVNLYGGGPLHPLLNMRLARAINWAAEAQYRPVPEDAEVQWRGALDEQASLVTGGQEYDRLFRLKTAVLKLLAARWPSASGTHWMLRNLTTKQYARCRPTLPGSAQCIGYIDHSATGANPLRVDDVMLMYIGWTVIPLQEDSNNLRMCRGAWAGHCFDIVSQQEVDSNGSAWEDITDKIVKDVAQLRDTMRKEPRPSNFISLKALAQVGRLFRRLIKLRIS